jgi:hypothetical protein
VFPEEVAFNREKFALERERFEFDQQKHMRDRWWLEENAVNQRLSWLLTSQAFIGAAYAYLLQQIVSNPPAANLKQIALGLPLFAALLCFCVLIGILAAHEAKEDLRKMVPKHMLASRPFILNAGRLVPLAIVFFFMAGWLAIFVKH